MPSRDDTELLLGVALQLAKKLLEGDGGVRTFGGVLKANRTVTLIRPRHIKRDATLEEVDAYWVRELRRVAVEKAAKTACFCAEILIPSNTGAPTAAVLVRIEQDESSSEERIYPYRKQVDSDVSFDEPTVTQLQHRVFSAHAPD